jgi:hypothetical protein
MLKLNQLNGFGRRPGETFDFSVGLRALWRFNEAGSLDHPQDSSGRGNHLVLSGTTGAWSVLSGKAPASSNARRLTNNNRKLVLPSSLAPDLSPGLTGSFTWAAWLEPYVASGNMGIIDKWQAAKREYHLFYNHVGYSKRFTFLVSSNGSTEGVGFLYSDEVVEPNSGPVFVVAAYDYAAGLKKISVNAGAFKTQAQASGAFASNSEITVGCGWNYSPIWDGWLGSIAYWNRSLSQAEVTYLYNGGAGRSDM